MPKRSREKLILDKLLFELGYFMWYKIDQIDPRDKQTLSDYRNIMYELRLWFTPKFPGRDLGSKFTTDLEHIIELKYKGNVKLAQAISEEMKSIHSLFFTDGILVKDEYVDISNAFYEIGNFLWHKIDMLSLRSSSSSSEYARFCLYLIDSFDTRMPAKRQGYGFMIKLRYWALLKQGGIKKALQYGETIKKEYPDFFNK
ncbi:MAG TPA: hypothetical protein VFZ48_05275 [Candidatus Saccharimonadales bacterium]